MTKQDKVRLITKILKQEFPHVETPLLHSSAHELLIATILSARNTDKHVNEVTPALFKKYPTIQAFAQADEQELKSYIRTIGFYNSKTKYILGSARMIVNEFDGKVPDTMEDLVKLPGVARKTANVVLSNWFGKNEGFAVDTHVIRLANWWGLTTHQDPVKIERDLMKLFPRDSWGDMSLRIILHGRQYATSRGGKEKDSIWIQLRLHFRGDPNSELTMNELQNSKLKIQVNSQMSKYLNS